MMVLKINSLARGFSGIRLSVIQALMALVNAEVYPWIPAKLCRCSCWGRNR
ncbi:histidine ammonia-lyase domain protein [Enterobacter hormaechei subsp. xiangfangensis]|nr:aromatic amino acid lyase [Enterobacter hormaechei]KHG49410.1 histidine ammonia-lyase domain protein [Enterobacter hormaechei subsp. xiangfangensis]